MATKIRVDDAAGNGYNLVEVDGIYFPEYFAEDPVARLKEIREMPGRDDDVIIAAYPKAGTHWVWEITNMLLRGTTEYHPAVKEEQMIELKGALGSDQLPSSRVFNTHLLFRQLPADMVKRNCKIISLSRNPKDMSVSRYYHVSKGDTGYKGSFKDYLPLYTAGKRRLIPQSVNIVHLRQAYVMTKSCRRYTRFANIVAFSSWFDYTLDWDKSLQENRGYPVHTVVYEELKRHSVREVQKLANFLGTKSDEAFIKDVCDKCSFSNLKSSYEQKQTEKLKPTEYAFRKGEIGDWKNWFTVAMSEEFDAAIEEKFKGFKHDFIYE